jgi:hypothetical protein
MICESSVRTILQPVEQDLVTVKQAAALLKWSVSKLYRIDRRRGPFRIWLIKHRVYVDLSSLLEYMRDCGYKTQNGLMPESGSRPMTAADNLPDSDRTDDFSKEEVVTGDAIVISDLVNAGCGQRDLPFPDRIGRVGYVSWFVPA